MNKHLLITILLLVFSFASNAQTRKTYPTDRPAVSISNQCGELSEHVWWGVDNRFRIIVEGADCDSLSITSDHLNFEYLGDCYYNVTVKDTLNKGWVKVFIKYVNRVDTIDWTWSILPSPRAYLALGHNYSHSLISRRPLMASLNYTEYSHQTNYCLSNYEFEVLNFSVEAMKEDSSFGKWEVKGSSLLSLQEELGILKAGDKLIFTNILVKGPDGIIRKTDDYEYIVK